MDLQTLSDQWQELEKKRQVLVVELTELERRLNNFSWSPESQEILDQKGEIRDIVVSLHNDVLCFESNIRNRKAVIKNYHLIANGRRSPTDFLRVIENLRRQLADCDKKGVFISEINRCCIQQILEMAAAPSPFMELLFSRQNLADQERIKEIFASMEEAKRFTEELEELRRARKKILKESVSSKRKELEDIRRDIIFWASRDRQRLGWIAENHPEYKDDAMRCYKELFPSDDLSDIFPAAFVAQHVQNGSGVHIRIRKREPESGKETGSEISIPDQRWNFIFVSSENDEGCQLPQSRRKFIGALQSALAKQKLLRIDPGLIRKKLLLIVAMDEQQRCAAFPKILGNKFHNWHKMPVGSDYRMLVLFNGKDIRFFLCLRKEYNQILAR